MGLFRKGKNGIIAQIHRTGIVTCSHSTEGKTSSYSRINMVHAKMAVDRYLELGWMTYHFTSFFTVFQSYGKWVCDNESLCAIEPIYH